MTEETELTALQHMLEDRDAAQNLADQLEGELTGDDHHGPWRVSFDIYAEDIPPIVREAREYADER